MSKYKLSKNMCDYYSVTSPFKLSQIFLINSLVAVLLLFQFIVIANCHPDGNVITSSAELSSSLAVEGEEVLANNSLPSSSSSSLVINQIISNLSLFNDDSNEYDSMTVTLLENVTHACLQRCIEEESLFLNDFGVKCVEGDNRAECYRARCFKGCELWWHALKEFEPCQEACSSTQFYPFDLPCISACERTQRQYWHLQRLHVERLLTTLTTTPATTAATLTTTTTTATATMTLQPQLLHDNETLNTLTLKWPITTTALLPAQYLTSRPFNIQYQYVLRSTAISNVTVNDTLDINRGHQSKQHESLEDRQIVEEEDIEQRQKLKQQQQQQQEHWWNLADYNCNENFECDIMDGLMPYTSYKFRFELPFGNSLDDMIYSPSSEIYTTPAMGSPISKPIIKQSLALDDSHVAVFWQAGKFINGPLTNYKIKLQQQETNLKIEKLLTPDSSYHVFSNLVPSTLYTLQLSMLNQEGEGPYVVANITTKSSNEEPELTLDDFNYLIIAGEYSVILKSLDPLIESRVLFKSEEILKDFDLHQHAKRLFVLDVKGSIFSLFLDNPLNYTLLKTNMEDFLPSKLSVDWLNQRLYVAGETSSKTWQILCMDFNGSSIQTIQKNLQKPLLNIQIDPINGWLFASDNQQQLLKINLASLALENIPSSYQIPHFSNDFESYLLKVYNREERNIYELSYDAKYNEKLVMDIKLNLQGEIQSFQFIENSVILMNNGSHLQRQHLQLNELEIVEFKEVEWCLKVLPLLSNTMARFIQPLPKPKGVCQNLQAIVTSNKAKITWNPPEKLEEFQSNAFFQNWEYELDILDVASNNAFNIRSIKSTYFQVERLQPSNLYQIKVRALYGGAMRPALTTAATEWSEELVTRTWPMGKHEFLWATEKGLRESTELLKLAELKKLDNVNVKSFVQVNTSLYYVNGKTRDLSCLNLMNPEITCPFKASNVYSVDYDWRGGKLYWSDIQRNCIVRSELRGDSLELLNIFDAKTIKLDSYKGHIYYTTDTRLVRRNFHNALDTQELEFYHINGNGETIQGFTLDVGANMIYWLVQHQEGLTKLFRSDMDMEQTQTLYDLPESYYIATDTFNYLPEIESFIWLKASQKQAVLMSKEFIKELTEFPIALQENVNFIELKREFTNFRDLSVIPDKVDKESIHITEGYWDDFNIKWSPVLSAENLTIFYRVLITTNAKDAEFLVTFEVEQPMVRITEFKMAGYAINITITPQTLWSMGASTTIQLKTPSAAPKQPKNLRVFVEQMNEPLQTESNISALVRWDSPDNISTEKEVFYKVYCWLKEELFGVKDIEDMGLKTHEVRFYNLQREESYMFQVQAFSQSRSQGGEKTSVLTYFINPEVQAIPRILYTTSEYIGELDLDINQTKIWVHTSSEVEHLSLISGEQRLIWVNENVELMSYQPGSASLKLARMRAEVLSLTVDWILRKVYWAELTGDIEHAVDIYELDLNQYEGKVMLGSRIFSLNQGKLLKNLVVLPYSCSLLWLSYDMGSKNCSLQGRNLTDFSELKFKNQSPILTIFEGSLIPEMESLNLVDFKGKLTAYEIQRQLTTILKIPLNTAESIQSFQRDQGYIYTLNNHTIKAFNRRKHNMEYTQVVNEIRLIKSFNYQEYPKRECLIIEQLPEMEEDKSPMQLAKEQVEETYFNLQLPLKNPFENCKLPIPGLKYHLNIKGPNDYEQELFLEPGSINITQLTPYSNYSVDIDITSYYQQKLSLNPFKYPEFIITTYEGTPSIPLNFSASAISPSEILVTWLEPVQLNAESVIYHLYWQLNNSSLTSRKIVEGYEVSLINLEASQDYLIWLDVYPKMLPDKLNSSDKLLVQTFPEPELLRLIEKQAYNLTLLWLPNTEYDSVILECRPLSQDPSITAFSIDITGIADNITVTNLEPKTKYEFYLKLNFASVQRSYNWPELASSYFIYETLADAPGRPGKPQIEHITGEIFKVFWEEAPANGAAVVEYSLEGLQARQHNRRIRRDSNKTSTISMLSQLPWVEELQPIEDKWVVYCNTSELSCIVRELHTMRFLMFRVRARNDPYGWGVYSEDSERVLEPFVSPQKRNSLVLAIIAPAAIVTTCVIILFIIRKVHKRRLKAKQLLLAKSRPSIWSNFSTVQQQQLASRNRAFSMASASTMYTGGPLSDADIALLPHINWSQITLLNFLGSGAFGEVYEGLIKHEDEEEPEKVAIKSLRKGASEFAELLQEAQLMSNFKHDNIVRLIGVCCDTESISIIMEHMEGGDLLSYLRESRPNSTKPVASLQLLDLMTMCIDVATGMAYLEDMHFVHRDLACRNCLVSSRIPSKRMVKIGDFGLARDIYKNDYYRKEGEALMPVRWMAPESLVDGVFTTQTDVWAFGVLCWEILTLGQQPYAARNNFEVLNYVKEGGRLEQPDNCPDKLFSLMLECWHTESDERPTFRKCFNSLLAIKTDVRRVSLGYNIDDSDYAMYANQHGIVLSSFLASGPLNKVKEEIEPDDAERQHHNHDGNEIIQNSLNLQNEEEVKMSSKVNDSKSQDSSNDRIDLKVRFNNNVSMKDLDGESVNDESQLIDTKLYRIQENPDYYSNEGISRL